MIQDEIAKYHWYHRIQLPGTNIVTPGQSVLERSWAWNLEQMGTLSYAGKAVLDVGARDCKFSLEAERLGAARVDAIDNDLSLGALNVVLPAFKSKVSLRQASLYDLPKTPVYDIVLFFGVLYHLRYPFLGLRVLVQTLKIGGKLAIESGMLNDPALADMEILYCPVERSPYEPSSCSFFNECGLDATMKSMGCARVYGTKYLGLSRIERGFVVYQKEKDLSYDYWEGIHNRHSTQRERREDWVP